MKPHTAILLGFKSPHASIRGESKFPTSKVIIRERGKQRIPVGKHRLTVPVNGGMDDEFGNGMEVSGPFLVGARFEACILDGVCWVLAKELANWYRHGEGSLRWRRSKLSYPAMSSH